MFEISSQIIICFVSAALLGWVIGYLMGQATCKKKAKFQESQDDSHELPIDNKDNDSKIEVVPTLKNIGVKPLLLSEAREGGKDDLQLIKGVGKVLEKVLNETGIYHLDQIAHLTEDEVLWLDNSMSFPGRIKREKWVAQTQELVLLKKSE